MPYFDSIEVPLQEQTDDLKELFAFYEADFSCVSEIAIYYSYVCGIDVFRSQGNPAFLKILQLRCSFVIDPRHQYLHSASNIADTSSYNLHRKMFVLDSLQIEIIFEKRF